MSMTVRLEQTFGNKDHLIGAFGDLGFLPCQVGPLFVYFSHTDLPRNRQKPWISQKDEEWEVCYDVDYTEQFEARLGKGLGRLKQHYGVRNAEAKLRAEGRRVRRKVVGDKIKLYVGV